MKKYKKLFVSLLAAAVLTVGSAFSVMAADTYTYKVTVYAGNKGTIDGQEQKEITGLSLGSQVILDINSVKVTDDKYYVKGFRLSGRDNEEALGEISVENAKKYMEEGHFGEYNMLPKLSASVSFIEKGEGRSALITSFDKLGEALKGKTGTKIS